MFFEFRLCLVAVKRFPENTYFPEMLIFGKGKCFHGVWLHFKKIFRKIFSGVWKRRRKTQIQKNTSHNPDRTVDRDRRRDHDLAFFVRSRSTAQSREASTAILIRCDLAKARSRSLRDRVDGDLHPVRSRLRFSAIAISIRRALATAR